MLATECNIPGLPETCTLILAILLGPRVPHYCLGMTVFRWLEMLRRAGLSMAAVFALGIGFSEHQLPELSLAAAEKACTAA